MTALMQGKRGLVMGVANHRSLGWGIAKACRGHGAELAFTYQGEALKKRVEPLARVAASATHALDPQLMGIAPAWAIPKALERAGIAPGDVDVWEVHEAFAAQALGVLRELPNQLGGFTVPDDDRLNPNGGAVAIGHPLGSSGTRYVLTLATELRLRGARETRRKARNQHGTLKICQHRHSLVLVSYSDNR